ncbi:MAG: HAD family hydrolase [Burkholderiales bacterium]|nr:HAD family hydrolase [Burkholderiales bacterium]
MQRRAVLFDLDDTLVDHRHAARAAMAGVRGRFPAFARIPLDVLDAEHQRILDLLHHEVAIGARSVDDARIDRYRRLFAFAGADGESAAAAAELHRREYQANRRTVEGAVDLLAALRPQVRIAVVTNNTLAEQSEKLAAFGLSPFVDTLVTSGELGVAKPDGRIFAEALRRVGCDAEEAVMVGDSWVHDVEGARAAGIAAVWLNRTGAVHADRGETRQLTALTPAHEVAAMLVAGGR